MRRHNPPTYLHSGSCHLPGVLLGVHSGQPLHDFHVHFVDHEFLYFEHGLEHSTTAKLCYSVTALVGRQRRIQGITCARGAGVRNHMGRRKMRMTRRAYTESLAGQIYFPRAPPMTIMCPHRPLPNGIITQNKCKLDKWVETRCLGWYTPVLLTA